MRDDLNRDREEETRVFQLAEVIVTCLALLTLAIVAWLFSGAF